MKLLPKQKYVIITKLPKAEVVKRLREKAGPKRRKNFVRVDRNIFLGHVSDDAFALLIHKNYRNSWTPQMSGTISEKGSATEISLTLALNPLIIAFTAVFVLCGLVAFVVFLIADDSDYLNWFLIFLVLVPYGLAWFGFHLDANKSITALTGLIDGRVTEVT
jgi:hypothetical protein